MGSEISTTTFGTYNHKRRMSEEGIVEDVVNFTLVQLHIGRENQNWKKNQKTKAKLFLSNLGAKTGQKVVPKVEPKSVQNWDRPKDSSCIYKAQRKADPENGVRFRTKAAPMCDQKLFDGHRLRSSFVGSIG